MPINMQLTIIRHGESANNQLVDKTIDHDDFLERRSPDPGLTARGKRQAELVGRHLAASEHPEAGGSLTRMHLNEASDYGVTQLYTSAMRRAMQTTRPIAEALGIPARVWVDIHEHGGMFHGNHRNGPVTSYPGMTRAEIAAEYPEYELPDDVTEEGWWRGGYEDMAACEARATRVAETLKGWAQEQPGEHIAMVTHGTFLDRLLKALLGIPFDSPFFFVQYNTGITRIDFMDNDFRIVRYVNRVQHLPAADVTK